MVLALLKYGLSRRYPAREEIPQTPDLKPHYDVVIVGGGGHGVSLANELDNNMMYSRRGQLTLSHSDSVSRALRLRADSGTFLGEADEILDRQQIKALVPTLNLDIEGAPDPQRIVASECCNRAARRRGLGVCRRRSGADRRGTDRRDPDPGRSGRVIRDAHADGFCISPLPERSAAGRSD